MKIRQLPVLAHLLLVFMLAAPVGHAAKPGYSAPEVVAGARTVTVEEVKELFDAGVVIVDVRSPRLHARRHIPGAIHLDLKDVFDEESLAAVAKKDEPLVIYCSGAKCSRSSRASADAVSWGYKEVLYFRGGIVDWRDAGYPVESGETQAKP
jgi:rhodanese-related sulfurtransferase